MPHKFISVVIPALNEEANVARAITSSASPLRFEIIVVDGGSTDKTVAAARKLGAKVVSSERGRGRQLNAGAQQAAGDMLLFLHADSMLPQGYGELMEQACEQYKQRHGREAQWGCFESIAIQGIPPLTSWLLQHCVAVRTHLLSRPYGDQGLFVRRATFERLGGCKEWPLLEDLELVQRLGRTCGPPTIVRRPVRTSGRRWATLGLLRTTLINQAILAGYALGVDVHTLAGWYAWGAAGARRRG